MAYTTINDPSAYFQTKIYTGDLSDNRVITNDGNSDLQPDWIWFKNRDTTNSHNVLDSTRGIGKKLEGPDNTNVEANTSTRLTSFDSNGFTVRTDPSVNGSGNGIVAWQWKANGGTTSSNTNGTITSTVQADTTAGFSIVTYTGTGSGATVGHGLGAIPRLVIVKNRSSAQNWRVFHQDAYVGGGYGQYQSGLKLNEDHLADHGANSYWNNDPFTTSTFSVGVNTEVNGSGNSMIAYCFAEKQGYSKFGLYKGNGNADGPFVYTGFKPAWVMTKRTDSSSNGDWAMYDNKRSASGGGNENNKNLRANDNIAEASNTGIDILSNGVKMRSTSTRHNAGDGTYIYMAFAEHPFVSSTGTPTTAR